MVTEIIQYYEDGKWKETTIHRIRNKRSEEYTQNQKNIIHLERSLHVRNKGGAFNFIGSISKTLFGTLDSKDLDIINQNIDELSTDNNDIIHLVHNQSAIIKVY